MVYRKQNASGPSFISVTGVLSYLTHVEAEKPDRLGTADLSELLKLLAATGVHSDLTDVEAAEVGRLGTADLSDLLEVVRSKPVINVSKSNSSGHWVSKVFSMCFHCGELHFRSPVHRNSGCNPVYLCLRQNFCCLEYFLVGHHQTSLRPLIHRN